MPVNTTIQIRRDTAANWESVNPILDAGEMGYTTDTKVLKIGDGVTAWNSLDVNSQRNALVSYSPRSDAGARLSGTGLVINSTSPAYNTATIPHVGSKFTTVASMEWRIDMALANWATGADQYYFCKYSSGTATTQTWMHSIIGDGTPRFYLSDGTSTISPFPNASYVTAAGLTNNSRIRLRIVYVRNTGSGSYGVSWFYSNDFTTSLSTLSTWTQLGTTVTGTSIGYPYDVNTPITINSLRMTNSPTAGTYYQALMFVDGSPTPLFDADFRNQTADAMMFYPFNGQGVKSGALVNLGNEGGTYATAPDSAALSITGDLELVMRLGMHDWTPSLANRYLFSKRVTASQRSWMLEYKIGGELGLYLSSDGTNETTRQSSIAAPFVDNTNYWIKATIDVDNGAGGNDVKFFYAADSVSEPTSWTQLGTTVTNAGTISLFDSTAPVQINGWQGTGSGANISGRVYRAIIRNGIDGTKVFDADFTGLADDTNSFTESSSNAATVSVFALDPVPVYINSTMYSFGLPDTQMLTASTSSFAANYSYINSFEVESPVIVDSAIFETTSVPTTRTATRFAVYRADTNNQPTGNAIIGPFSVDNISAWPSTYAKDFTPVTLQPGSYAIVFNTNNASVNYRIFRTLQGSLNFSLGSSSIIGSYSKLQTSLPTTAVPADSINTSTVSAYTVILLRWRAA